MTRKLVYIISSLNTGGAEVALLSAISTLNKSFDFRLVCLKKYDTIFTGSLTEDERKNIITFNNLPFNYLRALWFIIKFKPEIIISSLWKGAVLGIMTKCLKPKIKYIEFIHNSKFFHYLDKLFTILATKISDKVFCDSTSSFSFISKYTLGKPVKIISFLRFDSPQAIQPKEKIRLKALYIGRFHEQKRIDRLVVLVKKLSDAGLQFEVDLFGRDDGTMNSIKQLIVENNLEKLITCKGEITSGKVKSLFQHYDYYFQTSEIEGMAMSVVEAMQHGLVSVVTNVGEIKNYTRNGENAIVISEPFENQIENTIQLIKKTTVDIEFYNKLAQNAYLEFAEKMQFCDSLVNELTKV